MNIVIASGGTLGHLTPILPVVEVLSKEHQVYLITTKKLEFNHKFKKIFYVDAIGRTKNIFKFIKKNLSANSHIKKLFKEIKPDLIIGMGGYISGIVVRLANKNKIKSIIHEQNSVLGLSNKLVVKNVDLLIHSYFNIDYKGKNKLYLPNPRIEESRYKSRLYKKKTKNILITSGTNGARSINEIGIALSNKLSDYNITLITGKKYFEEFKKYKKSNLNIIPFTKNLISFISKADIVISRAGATSISEIIGSKTKAIYIPSPNVTNNHQTKNTSFVINNNLGIVLLEEELSLNKIIDCIKQLENNSDIYINNLNKLSTNNIVNRYIKVINEVLNKNA